MKYKSKRRIVLILLFSTILMAFIYATAYSAPTTSAETDFTFDNVTGTITGYVGPGGDVVIPSTIGGVEVTTIGQRSFQGCKITSLIIPNSVTTIGECAFQGIDGLENITIPSSVVSIAFGGAFDSAAFQNINVDEGNTAYCSEDGVVFDKSKTTILQYPCGRIGDYTIPDGVTAIGQRAFQNCQGISNLTMPEGMTTIGECAFQSINGLSRITIPSSVTSISFQNAFDNSSIEDITVEEGNELYSSKYGVVFDKSKTNLIMYPRGKKGDYIIPNGVTTISDSAFYGCVQLTGVTIPDGVTSIGNCAFLYCNALKSVIIPYGVTTIPSQAFDHCSALTNVTIPESVTSIGWCSFDDCRSLSEITIPSSVTRIDDIAFYECRGLTRIILSEGLETIGSEVFNNCVSLTNITIPRKVNTIGNNAFIGCDSLASIYFEGDAPTLNINLGAKSEAIVYYKSGAKGFSNPWNGYETATYEGSINTSPDFTFDASTGTITKYVGPGGNIVIPGTIGGVSVTSIGNNAFYNCSGLTGVTIPNSVTSIGDSAFYDCTGLTSISLSEGVTSIGIKAFYGCSGLTSINLPEGVTGISDYTFARCTGLTSVSFPQGVTTIGRFAFAGCSGLTSISLPEGVTSIGFEAFIKCTNLTSVNIPRGVTSIGDSAFYGCTSLTSISIPEGVTSIGYATFYGCTSLTSISISDRVTSIGEGAFYGCTGLTSINISQGVLSISRYAFYGCTGLTSISIPQETTSIGECSFGGCTSLASISFNSATTIIYDDADTIPATTKIIGYDHSTAKDYAVKFSRTFEIKAPATYTLTVTNGTGAGTYKASSTATVSALLGKKQFGGWSDELGNIISYAKNYSFIITRNMTLTAVLSDTTITPVATVTLDNNVTYDTTNNDYVLMYVLGTFTDIAPKGYELIDNGFISLKNAPDNPASSLTLNTPKITIVKASTLNQAGQVYRVIKTTYGATFYVRGYITFKDKITGKEETVYSTNVVKGVSNK